MAEDRGGQRPSRGGTGASRGGSAGRGSSSTGRGSNGRPSSGDSRGRGGAPDKGRGSGSGGYKSGDKSGSSSRAFRGRSEERPRTVEQSTYDGPDLPEEITGAELDQGVRAQLKGLPEKLAARVARHLAAAGMLIDEDPETAYQHTLAARARASRLAVVREATGEAAYAAGHYAEALAELRAAKRMNGATDYLPIMADCHRALGNPEQAIKLAKSPSVSNFAPEAKAEMTLVEAGARRDMGQLDAALRTLELAPLQSKTVPPGWSGCATRTPTSSRPPDASPTRWRGSTAPTRSTPSRSPMRLSAPTSWSVGRPEGRHAGVLAPHRQQWSH